VSGTSGAGVAITRLPTGTTGARRAPRLLRAILVPAAMRLHRRGGDRFRGLDLLYLTTVGARSGRLRTVPVARFDDGLGVWIVVASNNGAAAHPGWYHNLVANPDQVWIEVSGRQHRVMVHQLGGAARDSAWRRVVERAPVFASYQAKTDRQLPVLRFMPMSGGRSRL
jgi:deazaflavin-dependent oxidoreductase (nitroreductase family)